MPGSSTRQSPAWLTTRIAATTPGDAAARSASRTAMSAANTPLRRTATVSVTKAAALTISTARGWNAVTVGGPAPGPSHLAGRRGGRGGSRDRRAGHTSRAGRWRSSDLLRFYRAVRALRPRQGLHPLERDGSVGALPLQPSLAGTLVQPHRSAGPGSIGPAELTIAQGDRSGRPAAVRGDRFVRPVLGHRDGEEPPPAAADVHPALPAAGQGLDVDDGGTGIGRTTGKHGREDEQRPRRSMFLHGRARPASRRQDHRRPDAPCPAGSGASVVLAAADGQPASRRQSQNATSVTPKAHTTVAPVGRSSAAEPTTPMMLTRVPNAQPTSSLPRTVRPTASPTRAGTMR